MDDSKISEFCSPEIQYNTRTQFSPFWNSFDEIYCNHTLAPVLKYMIPYGIMDPDSRFQRLKLVGKRSTFIYRLNKIIWLLFADSSESQTETLFSNHITPGRLENLNNFVWFCFQSIAVYRFFCIAWLELKISQLLIVN